MVRDQRVENLEQFLAQRGQALLRTAVLLTGSIEAGEDLLQGAIERLLRRGRRLDGDPEGYLRRTMCLSWPGTPGPADTMAASTRSGPKQRRRSRTT